VNPSLYPPLGQKREPVHERTFPFHRGAHVKAQAGRFGDVFDPATGDVQAKLPFASRKELRQAVEAGLAAFTEWAGLNPPAPRTRAVQFQSADREKHGRACAGRWSSEHGKVLADSKGDISSVAWK